MALPVIVGIAGEKEAGKDTIASFLVENFGYERRAFGDLLKVEVAEWLNTGALPRVDPPVSVPAEVLGIVEARRGQGDAAFQKPTAPDIRTVLQWYGTEFRRTLDADYWVRKIGQDLPSLLVVSDCRFENELRFVTENGGSVWRVKRPTEGKAEDTHASEQLAKDDGIKWDVDLVNDGTVEDLHRAVAALVEPKKVVEINQGEKKPPASDKPKETAVAA